MGNSCQLPLYRDTVRLRSLSDNTEHITLKNLIQIKKGRMIDQYQVDQMIGQGAYGNVYRVTHKLSRVVRAAKRIEKLKKSIQALEESLILKRLDHPNIVRVYDIFYEKKYIHIVMDYCEGGELFARIVQEQTLTQAQAGLYMKQLLSAIHHCHTQNIMHRDLKPQNIMFLSQQDKSLKIIDFGVGTSFSDHKKTSLKVGSVYYMAPEVIKKKYNQKCDIWSLGVILYIMLTGRPPFVAASDTEIFELILKGEVPFPQERWKKITPAAKDLVERMLTYDPLERITAKEALGHSWINQGHELGTKRLLAGGEFESIRNFCHMNQFQSAIMVFISHNFMENELVSELEAKFKSIDLNGDGQISWEEFQRCYLENMPPIRQQELRELFQKLDKNHSGFIDYSQFISSTINRNYLLSENLVSKAFDMIDKDKNGSLSKAELMAAFGGCNYQAYRQILDEFDVNRDGQISKEEFKLAMKGLLKK